MAGRLLSLTERALPLPGGPYGARASRARASCARPPRAFRHAGMQIGARPGPVHGAAGEAASARGARIEVGVFTGYSSLARRAGAARGRPHRRVRRERGVDRDRAPLLGEGGRRAQDRPQARPGARDARRAARRRASRAATISPSSTRTRTNYLAYYERCLDARAPGRPHRRRQHALVGRGGRSAATERRYRGDPRRSTTSCTPTRASIWRCHRGRRGHPRPQALKSPGRESRASPLNRRLRPGCRPCGRPRPAARWTSRVRAASASR